MISSETAENQFSLYFLDVVNLTNLTFQFDFHYDNLFKKVVQCQNRMLCYDSEHFSQFQNK